MLLSLSLDKHVSALTTQDHVRDVFYKFHVNFNCHLASDDNSLAQHLYAVDRFLCELKLIINYIGLFDAGGGLQVEQQCHYRTIRLI